MRTIVSNTGPLLHLWEAGALEVLACAGEVLIPAEVLAELNRHGIRNLGDHCSWLKVSDPPSDRLAVLEPWIESGIIHAGEAAALALARHVDAAWFLTDDAAARLLGSTLGLEVHGSLGIILWAAASGSLDESISVELLNALIGSSLWVSPRIAAAARQALVHMFR